MVWSLTEPEGLIINKLSNLNRKSTYARLYTCAKTLAHLCKVRHDKSIYH